MPLAILDTAIIGAGPYGLSIAAHLRNRRRSLRIFGTPMGSWRHHMPRGMMLKSEGFASGLYAPDSDFTLRTFSAERGLPYLDTGLPVPIETFIAYGMEFQRRHVPELEETNVMSLTRSSEVFELQTALGETVRARNVVVATGISHFAHVPDALRACPSEFVSHSSEHADLSRFAGQRVAVIGAGASAVDIAALLHEGDAEVQLVARRGAIDFHSPSAEPRPLKQRILQPRSPLGLGWRSLLCTDAPLVFHALPERLRLRAVERHLGPAPGWFVRDKVVGRFPMHLGVALKQVQIRDRQVHLRVARADGTDSELRADHLIAATGYKPALARLPFLDDGVRSKIRSVRDTPILNRQFESSVPGLYFVGVASANSFGPLARFACGAEFTAKRIANHLAGR